MQKKSGKGIRFLILLLVLAIPLALAFFVLHQNLDVDLKKGSVTSLTLIHGESQDEVKEKEDLDFFVSLVSSGEKIRETAAPLSEYRKCEVVFHKLNRDVTYVLYLSDSVHDCVYTDPEDSLFLIPEAEAKALLAHPLVGTFAVSYATYPTLQFRQGAETYGACEIRGEWTHAKTGEKASTQKVNETGTERVILTHGDELDFSFSLDPDFCSVTLQNEKGEILYSGAPESMEKIVMEEDTPLSLTVKCDWYEEKHESYYGSLTYTFDVFYDVPTECILDRTTASQGQLISLTVKHSSSQTIAVSATFATDKIQQVKSDGTWSILIPVAADATAGEYSLMIMGSDVEKTFPITIV